MKDQNAKRKGLFSLSQFIHVGTENMGSGFTLYSTTLIENTLHFNAYSHLKCHS